MRNSHDNSSQGQEMIAYQLLKDKQLQTIINQEKELKNNKIEKVKLNN